MLYAKNTLKLKIVDIMKSVKQLFGTISVESIYLLKFYTFLKTKKQKNIFKAKYLTINNKLGVVS